MPFHVLAVWLVCRGTGPQAVCSCKHVLVTTLARCSQNQRHPCSHTLVLTTTKCTMLALACGGQVASGLAPAPCALTPCWTDVILQLDEAILVSILGMIKGALERGTKGLESLLSPELLALLEARSPFSRTVREWALACIHTAVTAATILNPEQVPVHGNRRPLASIMNNSMQ